MLRITPLATVLSALLVLTACTSLDGGAGPATTDPRGRGCGECTEELAAVRADVEALPDVEEVATLETYSDSPTNGAGVQVELRTRSTGDAAVMDQVAEIIWKSRLAPVDEVFVTVEDASGELVRGGGSPYDFTERSRQHDTYVEQWGPRPVAE
jgi:hypothetical protein